MDSLHSQTIITIFSNHSDLIGGKKDEKANLLLCFFCFLSLLFANNIFHGVVIEALILRTFSGAKKILSCSMCGSLSHWYVSVYFVLLRNSTRTMTVRDRSISLHLISIFRTSTTSFRSPNTSISSSASNLFGNNAGQTPKQKSSTLPARAK